MFPSVLRDEAVSVVYPEMVAEYLTEHARQDVAHIGAPPLALASIAPPAAAAPIMPPVTLLPAPPAAAPVVPPASPAAVAPPLALQPSEVSALAAVSMPPALDLVSPAPAAAPMAQAAFVPLAAPSPGEALAAVSPGPAIAHADSAVPAAPLAATPSALAPSDGASEAADVSPIATAPTDVAVTLPAAPALPEARAATASVEMTAVQPPPVATAAQTVAPALVAAPVQAVAPVALQPPTTGLPAAVPIAPTGTTPLLIASAPAAAVPALAPQPDAPELAASALDPEEMITHATARFTCARIRARFQPDAGVVALAGHVQNEADKARLAAELKAVPGIDRVVLDDVSIVGEPYCHVLAFLDRPGLKRSSDQRDNLAAAGAAVTLGATVAESGLLSLRAGMPLELNLAGPEFAAFVYISYFTSDGRVYHLLPTERGDDHRVLPNQRFKLGGAGGRGVPARIGPPFGLDIVLAVASSKPLFAARRPMMEPATAYLAAMDAALRDQGRATGESSLEYAYFLIRTRAGP